MSDKIDNGKHCQILVPLDEVIEIIDDMNVCRADRELVIDVILKELKEKYTSTPWKYDDVLGLYKDQESWLEKHTAYGRQCIRNGFKAARELKDVQK